MNKVINTKNERVFMSVVGPSGCGKSRFVFDLLHYNIFQPEFDKVLFFYQTFQPLYAQMQKTIHGIEFIQGVDFQMINNLPNNGDSYLLIFDDSCEEISKSSDFVKLATAGRHRGINIIFIKHNLYHKSSKGRDVELQLTHIVLFKSPRDVNQISILSNQLGLGSELVDWYKSATEIPFGHLMIDLCPRTLDVLRFSSGFNPTIFYLPQSKARITIVDDEYTTNQYTQSLRQAN